MVRVIVARQIDKNINTSSSHKMYNVIHHMINRIMNAIHICLLCEGSFSEHSKTG